MSEPIRRDRARGCMLGLAVGDALGAPLEGLSAQQIRSHYGVVSDYVDGARAWKRKPYRWRMPGLYSDDTQQALVLSDCLLEDGRIDPARLARTYLAMLQPKGSYQGAHRGVGKSFRQVLEALEAGSTPDRTGSETAGIGAAMRITPVGLHAAATDDPEALLENVLAASLMTHRDIRSLAGAVAVASMVRRLARGEERLPSLILKLAGDVARAEARIADSTELDVVGCGLYRHAISTAIARIEGLLEREREQALEAIVEEANRHGAEPLCRRPTMGFPPALIPTCIFLLYTAEGFEEALVEVVNLGGDTDTAGAILGAFAGACYGEGHIPARWLERLHNREGVALRAEALASGAPPVGGVPGLIETERRLTEEEQACREALITHRPSQGGSDLGANRRL